MEEFEDDVCVKPSGSPVSQLSVMLQNRAGALGALVRLLNTNNIEVIGMSMQDSCDATIARLILSDPEQAAHLFIERGIPFTTCDIVVVGMLDSSEGMMKCLDVLNAGETNVDFAYALLSHPNGHSLIALHLEDYEFGLSILIQAGCKVFYQEDLSR